MDLNFVRLIDERQFVLIFHITRSRCFIVFDSCSGNFFPLLPNSSIAHSIIACEILTALEEWFGILKILQGLPNEYALWLKILTASFRDTFWRSKHRACLNSTHWRFYENIKSSDEETSFYYHIISIPYHFISDYGYEPLPDRRWVCCRRSSWPNCTRSQRWLIRQLSEGRSVRPSLRCLLSK